MGIAWQVFSKRGTGMIAAVIVGLGGLQGVALADHGPAAQPSQHATGFQRTGFQSADQAGAYGRPPAAAFEPSGHQGPSGRPPSVPVGSGSQPSDHGQSPPPTQHGQWPPQQEQPPAPAQPTWPGWPGQRDGGHAPHWPPSSPATQTPSSAHPGRQSSTETPVATQASASPPSAPVTQPTSAPTSPASSPKAPTISPASTGSPQLGRNSHGLTQPVIETGAAASGLGATIGDTGTTGLVTTSNSPRLGAADLRALVSATPAARANQDPGRSARHTPVVGVRTPESSSPSVIQRIERVVPLGVWIALAAALAFAATAGATTLVTGRRARRQTARLAAVSAQALTDPLTGVLNRRGFFDAAERELARARRYRHPLAVAYVDVRGLKAVNDSEGHLAGDDLIREAAGLLESSARAADVVGRIGGDEMAVLLGEQSREGAAVVAHRIQDQVPERRAALQLGERWDLTIGTASYPDDGATIEELLAAADRRLYEQRGIELK